ncbi:MAG: formate dehydrogenase subunit alpha [Gammaproteobacteria bacterium]|nr:formate dehydrogenase subunit alpha [Gammaproteobacteria bacterium]NIR85371.1 formate dehydrogenase subunit alpha [Gammaproteobacteria bacterium]NIR88889.1 formate dehydrogenase subunit alpha [Gammaproteobacteria bacterium]NIU06497.1 formate dehydrogenase subunit alpha [Gammaproteobacteria bacterium]NIV53390.1 molybdopterin-dependent oxidoreductase [Gammaproteobacteria bacterium]
MKLIRKQGADAGGVRSVFVDPPRDAIDRRAFLRRSGLTLGGAAAASALPAGMMRKARASATSPKAGVETVIKRSVCTHCSVGCGVIAEVQNGVWTGQEPDFASPFNLGSHCAKGASVREHGSGHKRVKYPMKLTGGKWKQVSWDQAIDEIGNVLLDIRERSGPDSVWWCGSSKSSNEGSYLQRKFAAFWGTNNIDHQARICHSTTVAGVANTWGYGAMTNSFNDIHNSRSMLFVGSNAAEAHPVAMQHILRGKENGAKMIVVDPRFTRTAAHADIYVRIRPGSDVALMWGLLWHVFENGWEDRQYIRQRVYGMDDVREEVANWTPDVVEDVVGVKPDLMRKVAQTMAENRPGTIVWCMGGTQHHIGNNNTRAYCVFQLALGNIGVSGGGANIFRGHDNVQGATDVGPNCHTLPGYYGLSDGAWKHWARVWDVDYEWLRGRFDTSQQYDAGGGKMAYTMNIPGMPVSRWIDGISEDKANLSQRDSVHAVFFQGHAVNSQTRGVEMRDALAQVDLVVISDPYPTHLGVLAVEAGKTDGVYLLPTCTQFETYGSVTASNRSLQWREKVVDPVWESLPDHTVLYKLAKKLGFADQMFKNIAVNAATDEPSIEDTLREINRGTWTIGYTGQSPERLKAHLENKHTFNTTTLRAEGGPADGEYYGLPWPCWGTAEMKHPGTPVLYDPSKPVAEGGLCFRARFGVERNGVSLLAEDSHPVGSEIKDGHPEFTFGLLRQLGWDSDLTEEELATIARVAGASPSQAGMGRLDGVNWKTDLSGGIQRVAIKHGAAPFGNAKARCNVWTFPDPIPVHREPLYTPRYDLVQKYPTYEDRKAFWRLPTRYASIQSTDYSGDYPLIFISGRLTEYEGGGEETRSNPWLGELQQHMFVEINPADANDRGIRDGDMVWLDGPPPNEGKILVRAMVTPRVGRGVIWTPFHFGGWFQGKDLEPHYPEGTAPYVRGEACNTATTYGYDSVTQMQETKATLCQIRKA